MVEKSRNFGQIEPSKSPDLAGFRREVLERIGRIMEGLGRLGQLNFREEGVGFDPEDIFIPDVGIDDHDSFKTWRVLRRVGFPDGDLSVIFVARKAEKPKGNMVTIHGVTLDPNDPSQSYMIDIIDISVQMLFPNRHISHISLSRASESQQGAFYRRGLLHGLLLNNASTNEEATLLIVDSGDGIPRASLLALPKGWRTAVRDGRLIHEPIGKVEGVVATTILPAVSPEKPNGLFAQILEKVKDFPKPFTGGVLLGKEKSRTARFGSAGSLVEIIVEDKKITVEFGGLNLDALKEIGHRVNSLNIEGLASCFQANPNIPGRLVLEVTLDGKVKGEIKKWEILKRSLTSPSLDFDSDQEKALATLINDRETLFYFLTQLEKPGINPNNWIQIPTSRPSYQSRGRPVPTNREARTIRFANNARAVDTAVERMNGSSRGVPSDQLGVEAYFKRVDRGEGNKPVSFHIVPGSEEDKRRYKREKNHHQKRREEKFRKLTKQNKSKRSR